MTVMTLPLFDLETAAAADITHLYCCDENRSMCGLDLTDEGEVSIPIDECCEICVNKWRLGLPCGTPGCPYEGLPW